MHNLEIKTLPIESLMPADYNPREITDEALDGLEASIARWGLVEPIVWNKRTGKVVGGHQRLKVLRRHGQAEVQVVVVDLDDLEEKALNVTLNNPAIAGDYTSGLQELVKEIEAFAPDLVADVRLDELADAARQAEQDALKALVKGDRPDAPGVIRERFVVPPFSVLDTSTGPWRDRRDLWYALGVPKTDESRKDVYTYGSSVTKAKSTAMMMCRTAQPTSMFDPVLAELITRWFVAPGGRILDPFAGGPCRGAVAGVLGCEYVGIDLRQEQIDVNEAAWPHFIDVLPPGDTLGREDNMPDLTPVEDHGGYTVKRDDLFQVGGVRGGKVRTCWRLANEGEKPAGLVTAGSRQSPQVNIVAHVAAKMGIPCRVHTPQGTLSPEVSQAKACGATVVQHEAGYNNVIIKRARDDAEERGWREIPFGMECQAAVEETAKQVANIPADTKRIVMAVGSGMSLAGVLTGLLATGRDIPVLGVTVGADPMERLVRYAPPEWPKMVELVKSPLDYHDSAPSTQLGGVTLDPIYEAKALPFLQDGDMLWIVGVRKTVVPPQYVDPRWVTGDALDVDNLVEGEFDLVYSCPPYADLEVYSDDPRDISTMEYEEFDRVHGEIIASCCAKLKDDRFAVFVVGEVRAPSPGVYRNFVGHTIRAFEAAGLHYYNEMILVNSTANVGLRMENPFRKSRKVGQIHQNVLVFVKGDPIRAAKAAGTVDVVMPKAEEDTDG